MMDDEMMIEYTNWNKGSVQSVHNQITEPIHKISMPNGFYIITLDL